MISIGDQLLKTIEYLNVIGVDYQGVVFDRFKRYDESQKELNPINWLGSSFVVTIGLNIQKHCG